MGKNKIGPNNKCPCGSGLKFKFCCSKRKIQEQDEQDKLLSDGHEISSDQIQEVKDELQEMYQDHKVIDITNILNPDSYKPIQIRNYKEKTIMIAERKDHSEEVFSTRGPKQVNMIIMYRGAFQCFEFQNY